MLAVLTVSFWSAIGKMANAPWWLVQTWIRTPCTCSPRLPKLCAMDKTKGTVYSLAFRGLISVVLLWLFNILCGQANISELLPPHSAFSVYGQFLLMYSWAFHHRALQSDSWGESIKAYYSLNFFSRTSRFILRQNIGLRTSRVPHPVL